MKREISIEGPHSAASAPPYRLSDADILLTRSEAAQYLRHSVPTLERWAAVGEGPPFRKVGGRVLYPLTGLRRFAGIEVAPERVTEQPA